MSLGGALVHVPVLALLSPLVWVAALVAFGLVFRFLPPAREGRLRHLVSLATFGLGTVAILAASVFTGSVAGDAIDAARKQAHGLQVASGNPFAAAVWMLLASAVLAAGVWLRTRWPVARVCTVGAVYALGFAGVAMIQSLLPLNA
jgi:hypothetical protein